MKGDMEDSRETGGEKKFSFHVGLSQKITILTVKERRQDSQKWRKVLVGGGMYRQLWRDIWWKEERWKEKDMVFHVKLSQKTTILSRKAGRIV